MKNWLLPLQNSRYYFYFSYLWKMLSEERLALAPQIKEVEAAKQQLAGDVASVSKQVRN